MRSIEEINRQTEPEQVTAGQLRDAIAGAEPSAEIRVYLEGYDMQRFFVTDLDARLCSVNLTLRLTPDALEQQLQDRRIEQQAELARLAAGRALLKKYMAHVRECAGDLYLEGVAPGEPAPGWSRGDWRQLQEIASDLEKPATTGERES